jgi:hypothetical protein
MMNDIFNHNITLDQCVDEEDPKLSIHIRRQDIIDLFCLHGEDALGDLGGYVGNLLAEQIGNIIKNLTPEEIKIRRNEIYRKIRKDKEKRDATRNTDK